MVCQVKSWRVKGNCDVILALYLAKGIKHSKEKTYGGEQKCKKGIC